MEKLIEALNLIKNTCDINDCKHCPLSVDDECIIMEDTPRTWDVQDEPVKKVILR